MKVVAIIQARMGSTRLPKKSMLLIQGKPMLAWVIKRVKQAKRVDAIVVATTEKKEDRKIIELAKKEGVPAFAGPENDVLKRFLICAKRFNADALVRVCADNPFIDQHEIDRIVGLHLQGGADYTANSFGGKPGIQTGTGLAVEVMSVDALEKADSMVRNDFQREHVTMFFYTHPELFRLRFSEMPDFMRKPGLRLTIDTKQDLLIARKIYKALYRPNRMLQLREVIGFFENNKELYAQMRAVDSLNKKTAVR